MSANKGFYLWLIGYVTGLLFMALRMNDQQLAGWLLYALSFVLACVIIHSGKRGEA